jgi:predicted phosphodiesterase
MNSEFVKIGDDIKKPSPNIRLINHAKVLDELKQRQPSFTAAHITDIHLKPFGTCLARLPIFKASLQGQNIDYILNTGDSLDWPTNSDLTQLASFVADMNAIKPMIAARGNHDGGATNVQLGMPTSNYFYQDIGTKWRIIVLYSQGGGNYSLGTTQMAWLSDLLGKSSDKNVCIMSHVPICGVAGMIWYTFGVNPVVAGTWNPTVDQHNDISAIVELFRNNPCVKVALSGHQHIYDDTVYQGVRYLCGGAVCADWWNTTNYHEKYNHAGYRMIKFYDDGSVTYENIYY